MPLFGAVVSLPPVSGAVVALGDGGTEVDGAAVAFGAGLPPSTGVGAGDVPGVGVPPGTLVALGVGVPPGALVPLGEGVPPGTEVEGAAVVFGEDDPAGVGAFDVPGTSVVFPPPTGVGAAVAFGDAVPLSGA